ncbi:MAG: hypothetical protein KAY24_15655 [Candidatus Eisenbacteria sp.]|nr:hypothetical protein [Candidatus Eisenbacteria bacterium]
MIAGGSVTFNTSWGDSRYVNENQSSSVTSSMIVNGTVGQSDVSNGYVNLSNSQTVSGLKNFTSQIQFSYTGHPPVYITTSNPNGIVVKNNSSSYPTIWSENQSSNGSNTIYALNADDTHPPIYAKNEGNINPNYIVGVYANVPQSTHYGIGTNGRGYFGGGTALFTSMETSKGTLMPTSPLIRKVEVYLTGSGTLARGKVHVSLDPELADVTSDSEPIRVIVTPTEMCNGMAVTEKTSRGFTVEELADGSSNATFDWLVIAAKAVSFRDGRAEPMPEVVPTADEGLPPIQ